MLGKLFLLPLFPTNLYEVVVPVKSILLLLEFPNRLLPSLSWMHPSLLSLLVKNIEAELGNANWRFWDFCSITEVPPLNCCWGISLSCSQCFYLLRYQKFTWADKPAWIFEVRRSNNFASLQFFQVNCHLTFSMNILILTLNFQQILLL